MPIKYMVGHGNFPHFKTGEENYDIKKNLGEKLCIFTFSANPVALNLHTQGKIAFRPGTLADTAFNLNYV